MKLHIIKCFSDIEMLYKFGKDRWKIVLEDFLFGRTERRTDADCFYIPLQRCRWGIKSPSTLWMGDKKRVLMSQGRASPYDRQSYQRQSSVSNNGDTRAGWMPRRGSNKALYAQTPAETTTGYFAAMRMIMMTKMHLWSTYTCAMRVIRQAKKMWNTNTGIAKKNPPQ